jgi:hypothetical protein
MNCSIRERRFALATGAAIEYYQFVTSAAFTIDLRNQHSYRTAGKNPAAGGVLLIHCGGLAA